jgi:hypothetical protein
MGEPLPRGVATLGNANATKLLCKSSILIKVQNTL